MVGIQNIHIYGFDPSQKTLKIHDAKKSLVLLGPVN